MVDIELLKELGHLVVADVMVTEVITVGPEEKLENVLKIFRDKNFKGVPIVKNGRLLGMAYAVDLLKVYFMYKRDILDIVEACTFASLMDTQGTVDRYMDQRPVTVAPSDPIVAIAKKMVKTGTYTFPVVREGSAKWRDSGFFLGVVTFSDVIPLIYQAVVKD